MGSDRPTDTGLISDLFVNCRHGQPWILDEKEEQATRKFIHAYRLMSIPFYVRLVYFYFIFFLKLYLMKLKF